MLLPRRHGLPDL